jgi:DNA-binding protein HU-beta
MAGKADIVNGIVDRVEGLNRRQAAEALDAVVATIVDALRSGEGAKLPGFGSFSISERAARKGRNPATGETIKIKARKTVRFKVGKELKETVNSKKRR